MESSCNQRSDKQIIIDFTFEILQSSHHLPGHLCTLLALSTSFTLNVFPTVLKEFPHRLSTCWLLFLHSAVQLVPIGLRSGDCGGQGI